MKHTATERWLFIGLILSGFVCSWAAVPARADEWSKTYNLTGQPDLRVETSDANLHVSTWDQSSIEARVIATGYKIAEDGIRIEEHQTGNVVEIDVRYPHRGVIINLGSAIGHRVDIAIHMPREGRVDLHTGDGKIDLGNFKGEMVLRSGDGSQEIDGVDGKLRATTGDGHIRANGRFDELELKTGDVTRLARANPHRRGHGSPVCSRVVTVPSPLSSLPNLAAPMWTCRASIRRHIARLDIPVTTTGKIRENEVHGKLNGGGNLLVIHTGDGSIRLRKA